MKRLVLLLSIVLMVPAYASNLIGQNAALENNCPISGGTIIFPVNSPMKGFAQGWQNTVKRSVGSCSKFYDFSIAADKPATKAVSANGKQILVQFYYRMTSGPNIDHAPAYISSNSKNKETLAFSGTWKAAAYIVSADDSQLEIGVDTKHKETIDIADMQATLVPPQKFWELQTQLAPFTYITNPTPKHHTALDEAALGFSMASVALGIIPAGGVVSEIVSFTLNGVADMKHRGGNFWNQFGFKIDDLQGKHESQTITYRLVVLPHTNNVMCLNEITRQMSLIYPSYFPDTNAYEISKKGLLVESLTPPNDTTPRLRDLNLYFSSCKPSDLSIGIVRQNTGMVTELFIRGSSPTGGYKYEYDNTHYMFNHNGNDYKDMQPHAIEEHGGINSDAIQESGFNRNQGFQYNRYVIIPITKISKTTIGNVSVYHLKEDINQKEINDYFKKNADELAPLSTINGVKWHDLGVLCLDDWNPTNPAPGSTGSARHCSERPVCTKGVTTNCMKPGTYHPRFISIENTGHNLMNSFTPSQSDQDSQPKIAPQE